MLTHRAFRYGLALVGVAAAMGLRLALEGWFGPSLPYYITFYPIVMTVAVLEGFGPGVLATATTGLIADYWIIPPIGQFSISSPIDQVGMAIFIFMGLFMSVIAELYRRNRDKVVAYDRDVVLRSNQEALRASEERFQVMVNAMPQLGWTARPDGYITWYNERWYEYTGTTPEQMEGWDWQIVHDTVELPKVLDRWKTSIATGNPFEMTFPLRGADGNFRQFLTRGFPLKDADGCVVQWFGTNTDVEEQARIEKLLRESETRYRTLFETMHEGFSIDEILLDETGKPYDLRYLVVNPAFERHTGLRAEDIVGRTTLELFPDAEPVWFERYGKVALTGEPLHIEEKFGPLGKWFSVTAYQLEYGRFAVIFVDMTERKKTEMLLEKSEKQHRTLFENMLDGYTHCRMIYENDIPQDFIYLNVNSEFQEQTGLRNVVGKKVSVVIPGIRESNPELFEIFGRVILTGQPEKFEAHLESLGSWFSISVYSTEYEHFVALFDDITERKRTEQELLVANNFLTHEVERRTSDLSALAANIQKVAEIERANIARELHDELGSSLVAMSFEIAHAKNKTSDPIMLKSLSTIKEYISSVMLIMRNVVSQLYPVVLSNEGFTGAVKWLVKEYVKRTQFQIELIMPEENIRLEHELALAAYRITQECLTNVAKHSGASKILIEAKISDGLLDLTIHDNGNGLPEVIKTGGCGIFGMIERARYLGGSMEVKSETGNGTTAHLMLPLTISKPNNKKRVLVVDDHAIVRDALRQLLDNQTDDFSVEGEAADGNAGLQMALDGKWDVMLLDITMPKKNGIKVLEEVVAAKPELPIIMLSSHAKDQYGELALSKGAASYIEKGDTEKLVEVMRRATVLR